MPALRISLVLLLVSVSFGQEATLPPAPKLQCKWQVTQINIQGDLIDPKLGMGPQSWTIQGEKLTIRIGKREVIHKIKVDPSKKPGWLNLHPQGPQFEGNICRGIYKIEGDSLIVNCNTQGKETRPRDFSQPDLNSEITLTTMKRMK